MRNNWGDVLLLSFPDGQPRKILGVVFFVPNPRVSKGGGGEGPGLLYCIPGLNILGGKNDRCKKRSGRVE